LFVHGVNTTGKDSPDISRISEVFAASGFRVLVPDFSRMKRQNVTAADIEDVATAFKSLASDAGIICVSYGCGPALIAAARPEIRNHVRFVLTFGAYFDLVDTLQFIVTEPTHALGYTKWEYLAANLDLINDPSDRTSLEAIATGSPEAQDIELSSEGSALLAVFLSANPSEFRMRLQAFPPLRDRLAELSPSRHMQDLKTRLIIVHSSLDPCIPSSESDALAESAGRYHLPYTFTQLGFYAHTTPELPPFGISTLWRIYIPEGWKFVRVMNRVMSFT
jgi:hypothetical protein